MSDYKFNEYQKKWLAALRSGEYKQCKGKLWREDSDTGEKSYCCLGVASELFNPDFLGMQPNMQDKSISSAGFVSFALVDVLKLNSESGSLRKSIPKSAGSLVSSLVGLNDEAGYSFTEIAEYIENNPEAVFSDAA